MMSIPKCDLSNQSYLHLKMDHLSNGKLTTASTQIQLCYTKDNLNVKFINHDDFVQDNKYTVYNSNMWNQTVAELFIVPIASDQSLEIVPQVYTEIEVTPKGALYVCKITNPDGTGKNMQRHFFKQSEIQFVPLISTDLNKGYWSAHLTLPFSVIGGEGKSGQRFKANFFRVQMARSSIADCTPETCQYMAWQPTMVSPPQFHIPQFFGDFELQ